MSAIAAAERSEDVELTFAGQSFVPLPSGGLFWRAENALLVADLHLEKLSSFARRGSLLPPYDTGLTLRRLEADLEATSATEVISLGDSFHRDWGTTTLLDADRLRLDGLMERARWTWISGNHDPRPHGIDGCVGVVRRAGLTLAHHPQRGVAGLVAGHLHPSAAIHVNGRRTRRPCFVHDGSLLILPAYGAGTGTLNILNPAFAGLLNWKSLEIAMVGRGRVYPVHRRHLVGHD